MSSFLFLRTRVRALFIILFCVSFLGLTSFWAVSQRASTRSDDAAHRNFSTRLFLMDKGGVTPEANNIVVNSTADVANGTDGLCTLREAITAANNNVASGAVAGECAAGSSSADVIDLTSVTGAINLTGTLPSISSSMTLTGPGSAQLTVRRDTGGVYRIFTISSGTVAISGITITNGRTPDGVLNQGNNVGPSGGGIFQSSGALTLTDVVLTGNTTGKGYDDLSSGSSIGGLGGFGGGIDAAGTLVMTNCVVSNNTTGRGGDGGLTGAGGRGAGIFLEAQAHATLRNVTVTGNVTGIGGGPSNDTRSGDGAGIWLGGSGFQATATLDMINVSITNNSTADSLRYSGSGGGLYIIAGKATLTGSTVANNRTGNGSTSNGAAGDGGGIFNFGTLTVSGSTISGNSTGDGSNISNTMVGGGIDNGFILNMMNSTVSGNSMGSGDSRGGGIYSDNFATFTNCTITSNTSNNGHDGLTARSTVNMRNTILARNGPGGAGPDVDIAFTSLTLNSQGHNIVGNAGTISSFTGPGDQVGVDPLLASLANNGGPTLTHALMSNSPALDAGDNCVTDVAHCGDSNISQLTTDQRSAGFSRMVDGPDADTTATVDIGAYETQAPLANLADTSTNEDTQLFVPFDAGDTSTITSVTATSDNPALVPSDPLHLSAAVTGSTGVVTINPATNANGTTNITVTVNRTGGPQSNTLRLTVNAVNDAPSFTKGADQTVNEDAGAQTINNWATSISSGPPDESIQTVAFQITNNGNPSLFSVAPAISSSGTLTYTPTANANGSATITVSLKDNGGTANGGADTSASLTFTITVNAVNDAPSFTKGPDKTVNEDSGSQFFATWATGMSAGPSDESSQTLTFQVTNNTNTALFSSGPAVNSSGQLSFTPASNANGAATITIVLKDSGGTANGGVDTSASQTFTITVNSVNDAPSFTKGANQTVSNNAGAQTVANWATNISPGPADESSQTVAFQVTNNTNSGIFTVTPAISPTGTLTYTPNPSAGGTATISINLKDNGGTANGGADTSVTQTFTITITPIGGFFSFAASSATTTENSGSTTVTVRRTGDTSRAASVDYATNADNGLPCSSASGVASPKCDFTAALGTLNFAAGDINKTITILIGQDSFVEGPETITITLTNPQAGAGLATPASMAITISDDVPETTTNVIDDANLFVRMHYHDFLNREADQSGLNFWTGQMTNCGASDLTVCRVNVSGAFFLSIEFQQTGYLVERMYKSAYGDATGTSTLGGSHQLSVPIVRFDEFLKDTQRIGQGVVVLAPGWEQALEKNKQAYAGEFVATSRFITC